MHIFVILRVMTAFIKGKDLNASVMVGFGLFNSWTKSALWWKAQKFQQRNVWISVDPQTQEYMNHRFSWQWSDTLHMLWKQRYCSSSSSYLSGKQKVGDDTGVEKVNQYKSSCLNTKEDMKRHAEHAGHRPPVYCHPHWWTAPVDASADTKAG